MTRPRILLAVAILGAAVALAALAVAIVALSKDHADAARISTLQAHVRLVDESETQNRISAADQQISSLGEEVNMMGGYVAAFVNCIPELQTEIGGVSISWHVVPPNASEGRFNVVDGRQISKNCESTLYGGTGEHSPLGG
jgi:hypothetical protein